MTTTAGPGDRFSWDERVLRLAACIGFNARGLYGDVSEDDETSRAPDKMGAESARMLRGFAGSAYAVREKTSLDALQSLARDI